MNQDDGRVRARDLIATQLGQSFRVHEQDHRDDSYDDKEWDEALFHWIDITVLSARVQLFIVMLVITLVDVGLT